MITLSQIESDLAAALKARDQVKADTLRGLKTRIQNEKIAKISREPGSVPGGKELDEAEIVALVRSEVKRRKDAAQAYNQGGRPELAEKELQEAKILEVFLPAQMSEQQVAEKIDRLLSENNWTAKDFGTAMGKLKGELGNSADGGTLARLLKEKLK